MTGSEAAHSNSNSNDSFSDDDGGRPLPQPNVNLHHHPLSRPHPQNGDIGIDVNVVNVNVNNSNEEKNGEPREEAPPAPTATPTSTVAAETSNTKTNTNTCTSSSLVDLGLQDNFEDEKASYKVQVRDFHHLYHPQHQPEEQQQQQEEEQQEGAHDFTNAIINANEIPSQKQRRNSLELRRVPVDVLLTSQSECTELHDDDSVRGQGGGKAARRRRGTGGGDGGNTNTASDISKASSLSNFHDKGPITTTTGLLRGTCLNSKFNLRRQMMLSFGLVSAFAILLVVAVCIAVSIMSGDEVNTITMQSFQDLIRSKQGETARYLAESLTLQLLPIDLILVIYEATRDRFSGYPIYADDSQVPFLDIESQTNRYPILGPKLPLDWQMTNGGNVNQDNAEEHVQHRFPWYEKGAPLSTANAVYFIQGMCDPDVIDPKSPTYLPNCTQANNNMMTGGAISPTPTNEQVYRKAADLAPLLKALYEFYLDVKELGLYFANGGSGATLVFPHYELNTSTSYESIGCNWLLEPHPLDNNRLIGSMEDHARCEGNGLHVLGKTVSSRLYSPMDRDWCKNQAQNPDIVLSYGPYRSAWHESEWLMSIGRAVYDRVTLDFIGCIGVDFSLKSVEAAVTKAKVTQNSAVTIVRWDGEGTVVASSAWNKNDATRPVTIHELHVGVSDESFASLKRLVDFNSIWNPIEVRQAFENFHLVEDGFLVSAYPMPPPPESYDAEYRPEFFGISSIWEEDIQREVKSVSDSVNDTVAGLVYLTLVVGCIGLGAVVLFIFVVSHAITLPLNYMNDVSSDIVNTFGSHKEEGIEMTHTSLESKCSPKTELSDVVKQFQKMVSRFSGSAMARSMQVNVREIDNRFADNRFTLADEFSQLYFSRNDPSFRYKIPSTCVSSERTSNSPEMPSRIHYGSVFNDGAKSEGTTFRASDVKLGGTSLTSPLFFWIVALIVTPLLITTVGISAFVTFSISQGLFENIDDAKTEFIFLEKHALLVHAGLRASYGAQAMRNSIRDNYLITRYSSWLLFGGLKRTDSFTYMTSGPDECKVFSDVTECPMFDEVSCDCKWNDRFGKLGTCDIYTNDSRPLQVVKFFGLAEDVMPNGDRRNTSYPDLAFSPETTKFWSNVSDVPGSYKGSNASGYDTTYDRLRVASALPLFQTIYNADPKKESFLAGYFFFEADGLGVGYGGCKVEHLELAGWVSTEENGAGRLRPELCPVGKYGYDARCREWYHRSRELALVNGTGLYVTPPYPFATVDIIGQTCTSPLIDPNTNEHVGQTLVDFVSMSIFEALNETNTRLAAGGFPLVITGLSDIFGADTVIGPSFSLTGGPSVPFGDVVLPYDDPCPAVDCIRRQEFEVIRHHMKSGETGLGQFVRTAHDGLAETVHMAFAPINAKTFVPVNGSDFSRGVNVSDFLVYSLALVEPEVGLLVPFAIVENEIHRQINIVIVALALVIVFSIAFVIYISNRITLSMTEPMIHLLKLIQYINEIDVDGNTPGVDIDRSYGSREILNVVETMETLYRIVQSANVAFFNGDVERAYFVLADAARLFKRLDNSKAEGVANNNLGNTMLAFYRTLEDTDVDEVCGFNKQEVIVKGMGYYHKAIQLGEKAYDGFYETEGWSPCCLDFMQHLSNRYFNRAMFLLTVKDGYDRPSELEELGFRDLQITSDMDIEIVDQGTEVGWDTRGADKMFEVYLSRIRGHLLLLEIGYEDKWDVGETLDKAFDLLRKELNSSDPGSSLFNDFCPAGRMQQIETELMRYKMLEGKLECAAKIAVRILVEDEMTLQESQLKAVEVLSIYFSQSLAGEGEGLSPSQSRLLKDLKEYQQWLQNASDEHDRSRSCADDWSEGQLPASLKKSMRKVISDSESESMVEPSRRARMRLSSLRASTRGDVTMEVF